MFLLCQTLFVSKTTEAVESWDERNKNGRKREAVEKLDLNIKRELTERLRAREEDGK